MDDQSQQYAPDTVDRLITLFRGVFGSEFKSFWDATPESVPPETDFPLIIVQKLTGKAVIGPTSTDEVNESYAISVWFNKADIVGSGNVRTTAMRHLQHLVEGQDPNTLDYKAGTLMFALRKYLSSLNSGTEWLIDSDASVRYDQKPRTDLPSIAIADVTLTTQRRIVTIRNG